MTKLLAFAMTDNDGEITIENSIGEVITSRSLADLMRFLQFSRTGRNRDNQTIRIVWDLDAFLAPIIRKADLLNIQKLADQDNGAMLGGETAFYSRSKMFRTRKAYYYQLQEAFPTHTPAPSCVWELQERADRLTEGLELLGMGDFQTITSLVSIFGQTELGKRVLDEIPRDYEIPQGLAKMCDYAEMADRKEWIANYVIGNFDKAADWDISSAYPTEASRLPDLRDLEYWHSDKMTKREEGALFGFVYGRLYIDPDSEWQHTSPIMVNNGDLHGNPAGWLPPDAYSLDEIRFIEGNDLGMFVMEDGYFAKVMRNVRPRRPFAEVMEWFYSRRMLSPMCSNICKGMSNGLIGKLIEVLKWKKDANGNPMLGDNYNVIYHALITSGTRVKVARWLLTNGVRRDQLLAVQTDGVRTLADIEPPKHNGMGSWKLQGWYPTLIASPNIILCGDKRPHYYTHSDIVPEIQANPLANYYGVFAPAHITLQQAIQLGDISRVGELRDLPAHLDLPAVERQQNRHFDRFPKNGRQLLSEKYWSKPVVMEVS